MSTDLAVGLLALAVIGAVLLVLALRDLEREARGVNSLTSFRSLVGLVLVLSLCFGGWPLTLGYLVLLLASLHPRFGGRS